MIDKKYFLFIISLLISLILINFAISVPIAPSSVIVQANETRADTSSGTILNISGGRIATINISADQQNLRWKGFVGQVLGTFTLDDSSSSTLYDWTMTNVGGEIYSTRNTSIPSWTSIRCANTTQLEYENYLMNHTNSNYNITKTFNDTTHVSFSVGAVSISANICPTLNTYISNLTQDTDFEEIVLTDNTNFSTPNYANLIYSTIIETNLVGFDSNTYDFQMIVPEVGYDGFSGATAYYLYVELQ